jgi:hypothetical protein
MDYCCNLSHQACDPITALAALFREAIRLDSRITKHTLSLCFGWPPGAEAPRSPAIGSIDHFSAPAFLGFFPRAYFNDEVSDMCL